MENPVVPSSCVTPAGTSIEVQNEWEENTHTQGHYYAECKNQLPGNFLSYTVQPTKNSSHLNFFPEGASAYSVLWCLRKSQPGFGSGLLTLAKTETQWICRNLVFLKAESQRSEKRTILVWLSLFF